MKHLFFLFSFSLSILAACVSTQDSRQPVQPTASPEDFLQVTQDVAKGQFLAAFLGREKVRAYPSLFGQIHAMVGRTKEAKAATLTDLPDCKFSNLNQWTSREQYLQMLFESYDVVILNENHERPRHRATAMALLPILKKAGYDIFTAETFNDGIQSARSRGYAILKDGTYTKEPAFGNLVRSAALLGFDMFRYEPWSEEFPEFGDDRETREKGQAYLIAELVRKNPGRKVFVLSGRGHSREFVLNEDGTKTHLMGWFLGNVEGINALTISQTACADGNEASGLLGRQAEVPPGAQVDLVFKLPEAAEINGRPDWLWQVGLRPFNVDSIDSARQNSSFLLVEVYDPTEEEEAVPVDRLIVRANEKFTLAVPPSGVWHWRALDRSNQTIATGRIPDAS